MTRFLTTFRWFLLTATLLLTIAVVWSASSAPTRRKAPSTVTTSALVSRPAAKQVATKPATHAIAAKRAAPKATASSVAPVAAGTAGLKIYLDPETGQLGGPGNGAALANDIDPLNDSVDGLVEVRMPDGSYMLDMKGRFAEYAVIQTDASGKRVFRCVRSRAELMKPVPATTEDR